MTLEILYIAIYVGIGIVCAEFYRRRDSIPLVTYLMIIISWPLWLLLELMSMDV